VRHGKGHIIDHVVAAAADGNGEVLDAQQRRIESRSHRVILGSSQSRSASPSKLIPSKASAMQRPGKMPSQGACPIKARLLASILPQVGSGGGTPSPRKLNPLSASKIQPNM